MTKKRKLQVNVGVATLAVGALVMDKLILTEGSGTGPAPAEATQVYGAPPGAKTRSAGVTAEAETETDAAPARLDERLKSYDDVDPPRDPFRLSETLAARLEVQAPPDETIEEPEKPNAQIMEEFQSAHHLEAVLLNGDKSLAIVDGITVRLGQSLSGFTFVSVEERSATFEGGSVSVTLVLPVE